MATEKTAAAEDPKPVEVADPAREHMHSPDLDKKNFPPGPDPESLRDELANRPLERGAFPPGPSADAPPPPSNE